MRLILPAFALISIASSCASAAIELDGLYQDLRAGFHAGPAVLNVHAESSPSHASFGQVSRLIPTTGAAGFLSGFVGQVNPADFTTDLQVTNITSTSALATGTFQATDIDGDTISASVSGSIAISAGSSIFTGTLSNILFSDNFALDDQFDGDSGGSFSLSGFSSLLTGSFTVYAANIDVSLSVDQSSFVPEPSYAQFEISAAPTPAPTALFAVALATLLPRRRR